MATGARRAAIRQAPSGQRPRSASGREPDRAVRWRNPDASRAGPPGAAGAMTFQVSTVDDVVR
ncbi:MAG: hypothetical protein HOV96_04590 [Nonomuraea sp.]|nr:hypothetical protein [Nonomuraea sp.]